MGCVNACEDAEDDISGDFTDPAELLRRAEQDSSRSAIYRQRVDLGVFGGAQVSGCSCDEKQPCRVDERHVVWSRRRYGDMSLTKQAWPMVSNLMGY